MSKEKLNLDLVEGLLFEGYPIPRYGVCSSDDLDDVFCMYGIYDGETMTEKQLDILNEDYHDFMWETAFDELCT